MEQEQCVQVVAALIWREGRFLICQRPAHKARGLLWELAGGKVEPGESREQALVREWREELAVTLRVGNVFAEVTHRYPDICVHLTLLNAGIVEGEPQLLEHQALRWITPEEIDAYQFCPADTQPLAKLREAYGRRPPHCGPEAAAGHHGGEDAAQAAESGGTI